MQGKIIVVTGAFGTLGRAVAKAAADRGAVVAALGHAPAPPAGQEEELGAKGAWFGNVDLSDPDSANQALANVNAKFGRLDAVINAAGGFRWETIEDGHIATWDKLYAMNVRTAVNTSRAAIPALLESGNGRIVNVGANAALHARKGMGAYAASKTGVHRLTEALAEELKGRGVTVNAVLPSIIDTPVNRADMPKADFGKWVSPAELAAVILFLVSDQAKPITGALIPVTGGL